MRFLSFFFDLCQRPLRGGRLVGAGGVRVSVRLCVLRGGGKVWGGVGVHLVFYGNHCSLTTHTT